MVPIKPRVQRRILVPLLLLVVCGQSWGQSRLQIQGKSIEMGRSIQDSFFNQALVRAFGPSAALSKKQAVALLTFVVLAYLIRRASQRNVPQRPEPLLPQDIPVRQPARAGGPLNPIAPVEAAPSAPLANQEAPAFAPVRPQNQTHIEILREKLQRGEPIVMPDAQLAGADLQGANLQGADLQGANLEGANLSDANLTGALLMNSNLSRADLIRADLLNTNFSNAILISVDFENVKNFEKTILTGANFKRALGLTPKQKLYARDQKATEVPPRSSEEMNEELKKLKETSEINKKILELQVEEVSQGQRPFIEMSPGTILTGVVLPKANLKKAHLKGVSLKQANLYMTNLEEADLSQANLSNAILNQTNVLNTNFSGADFSNAEFFGVTHFETTTLRGADFNGAKGLTDLEIAHANSEHAVHVPSVIVPVKRQKDEWVQASQEHQEIERKEKINREEEWKRLRQDKASADARMLEFQLKEISQGKRLSVDMPEAILKDAQLAGVNLTNANLKKAKLTGVNLEGANLMGAQLQDAKLEDAILINANLTDANLEQTKSPNDTALNFEKHWDPIKSNRALRGANLRGAILTRVNLTQVDLSGAQLANVVDLETATLTNANITDVKGLTPAQIKMIHDKAYYSR